MKKLSIISVSAVIALSGCTQAELAPVAEEPVVAQAVEVAQPVEESRPLSLDEEFAVYLAVAGVSDLFLQGEAFEILVGQANETCNFIDYGDSPETIMSYLEIAIEITDETNQEVVDALVAASVAGTYTYCPEHEGFWD